jgi:hypothetical protein
MVMRRGLLYLPDYVFSATQNTIKKCTWYNEGRRRDGYK